MPEGMADDDGDGKTPHVKYEVCAPNKLFGHRYERDLSHFHGEKNDRGRSDWSIIKMNRI